MRMRFYILLIILLICTLGGMIISMTFESRGTMFYVAEGIIAAGIILIAVFYRQIIRPLNSIASGMDLLREQDFSSRLTYVRQPDVDKIVDIFNRMMDQLKAQRLNVHERNALIDKLVSASPMGIVMLDFDGGIVSANKSAIQMLAPDDSDSGSDRITGHTFADIGSALATAIDRQRQNSIETIRLSSNRIYRCSRLSFMDRGNARPFVLIESLTEEVMEAEKRAYGKVIRMIAHEVNNTMAGLGATLGMIDDTLAETRGNEDLREALSACSDRCADMTAFISAYANVIKLPDPEPHPTLLNEIVSSSSRFMESMCGGRDISLSLQLDNTPATVLADTPLLRQALINIIKNSVESIGSGGAITVSTVACPPQIIVTDNGAGISDEHAAQIFSPFFSTKPDGQGLGLLLISEVLQRHGCRFSLHTSPDDGLTRFVITFPVC